MSAAVIYSTNEKRFKKIDAWEIQKKITTPSSTSVWQSQIFTVQVQKTNMFSPQKAKAN